MTLPPTINVFKDADALAHGTARGLIDIIRRAVAARGVCSLALAGGETPRHAYHFLASEASRARLNWQNIHLFFGDERIVPPDNPQSNFGMVSRELLSLVPVPGDNVHRIRGELSAREAAEEYQSELRRFFPTQMPRFDLVLLGLGEDGHTASLFPGSAALEENRKSVVPVFLPPIKSWRVTLTFPVINSAREVLFLVAGEHKAPIVRQVLAADRPMTNLPATLVRPADGKLAWNLDAGAASLIAEREHPLPASPQEGGRSA